MGKYTCGSSSNKTKKPRKTPGVSSISLCLPTTPTGIRTPVFWLRTRHPRPLDDGGLLLQLVLSEARHVNVCRNSTGQIVGLAAFCGSTAIQPCVSQLASWRVHALNQRQHVVAQPFVTRGSDEVIVLDAHVADIRDIKPRL
jgi:hypothetical protein